MRIIGRNEWMEGEGLHNRAVRDSIAASKRRWPKSHKITCYRSFERIIHVFDFDSQPGPMKQPVQDTEIEMDPVRQRILDAAVSQFSEQGFEGASTRAIANAAGTAMSSITYQFGGKQGLYLAAANHIGNQIAEFMRDRLAAARHAVDGGNLPPVDAALMILGGMAEMMLDDRSQKWVGFIVREQQAPSEAFEKLYERFMQPVGEVMIEFVGRARPDLTGQMLRAVAMGLVGQVISLRAARATMLRFLGVETVGAKERALLREAIQANVRAVLEVKG